MNTICSDAAPDNPSVGDLWYNTTDHEFYVFDVNYRWAVCRTDDEIIEIILPEEDDPVKAYNRAMGVI